VVVVEDAADLRFLVRMSLESAGFEVVAEAATGEAGVAAALELRPDVVLVDLVLPDLDGAELVRRLRGRLGDGVRLVVCSALPDDVDGGALEAGADARVPKDDLIALGPQLVAALADLDGTPSP
jgi:DNA-binding response OmpR family regulator